MLKLRIKFAKSGRAVYLSHLDIMRTFARGFVRAGLPLKHSEGFNPHPCLSIAHPLPVGFAGENELLDCELARTGAEGALEALKAAMPEGLEILSAEEEFTPAKDIRMARYRLKLEYDAGSPLTAERIGELLGRDEIPVVKRSKKGDKTVDLKEHIKSVSIEPRANGAEITLDLTVKEAPISPRLFIQSLGEELRPDYVSYVREGFYTEDGERL
ncbi:MAG: TIGR03936 family radical SAM-associated protein [Oscillospiraceae bacterium]|jgi:radical SAM-linked protein|nr:TIGR03936 family radical SAM-associated protein [Oscillospiraceae bacterium]